MLPALLSAQGLRHGQIHLALEAGTLRVLHSFGGCQKNEAPVSLPRRFGNLYPCLHIVRKSRAVRFGMKDEKIP